MDVSANGLLATIPGPGISINRGTLNPCSILLPHIHPRATEIYYVRAHLAPCCWLREVQTLSTACRSSTATSRWALSRRTASRPFRALR